MRDHSPSILLAAAVPTSSSFPSDLTAAYRNTGCVDSRAATPRPQSGKTLRRGGSTRGAVMLRQSLLCFAALTACKGTDADTDAMELAMREERAATEPVARPPYRPAASANWARITGVVTVRGDTRRDTVVAVHDEPRVCGERVTIPLVRGQRNRLADAVVWIDGIRSGKQLPLERRFEVRYSRCRILPVVQSAAAGGMLMIRSADAIEHRTRMIRVATGEVVGVFRQGDAGSLIPVPDGLALPGLVELRSDPRPWIRAWVRVFDHPYHAVTPPDGAFGFDSLPPGRHRVIAWHPRFGRLATDVVVEPGLTVEVELTFALGAEGRNN